MCPRGYITADARGSTGVVVTSGRYGAQATTTYQGTILIKCHAGGAEEVAEAARVEEEGREEATVRENADLLIQKSPKFPELGATMAEAKTVCELEHGHWVDRNEKVGCQLRGANIFACELGEDATMRACTRWKLGSVLAEERDAMTDANGKPTSIETGTRGFRVYTWNKPGKAVTLTGYSAGVTVTETKADDGAP